MLYSQYQDYLINKLAMKNALKKNNNNKAVTMVMTTKCTAQGTTKAKFWAKCYQSNLSQLQRNMIWAMFTHSPPVAFCPVYKQWDIGLLWNYDTRTVMLISEFCLTRRENGAWVRHATWWKANQVLINCTYMHITHTRNITEWFDLGGAYSNSADNISIAFTSIYQEWIMVG